MSFNQYSEDESLQAILACCYASVQFGFRHLALKDIINPPHEWFDAMLARQIATHIMARHFNIPCRRIVKMQERGRTAVYFPLIG